MIRRTLRRVLGPRAPLPEGAIPLPRTPTGGALTYDMFDPLATAEEARAARTLERLYHKGQRLAWDGRAQLQQLLDEHGGIQIPAELRAPLRRVFSVILWGELAAWKISSELALHLKGLEPKMAATSQAHDEARHFYVMHDYLEHLDETPTELGPAAQRVLEGTLRANTLAKKLLGMQMMIEPMALTLFQTVRELRLEPVLADLLVYYERDEARHVALGVLHLPRMLEGMNLTQTLDLYQWQLREYLGQFALVRELADDFRALGVEPRDVLMLGRDKQLLAAKMMAEQLGHDTAMIQLFRRLTDFMCAHDYPATGQDTPRLDRVVQGARAMVLGLTPDPTGPLSNVAAEA